jgi:hypothetical protein
VIRGIVPSLGVFFDKRQQLRNTLVQRNLLGRVPEKRASVPPNSDFVTLKTGRTRHSGKRCKEACGLR